MSAAPERGRLAGAPPPRRAALADSVATKTGLLGVERRFDTVDNRFDGFDGVDGRLDVIDKRLDGMDKRFDAMALMLALLELIG